MKAKLEEAGMKTTQVGWIEIKKCGYPSVVEYGNYPTVLVSMKMVRETEVAYVRKLEKAELRFFGGDKNRPYWCSTKDHLPIENSAWVVTHWIPWLADPGENDQELTDESKA